MKVSLSLLFSFLTLTATAYAADMPPKADDNLVQTTKLVEPKEVPNENLFVRVKDTYRRESKQLLPKTS